MANAVSPQNAQKLALWLAHEHPQLFAQIHAKVVALKAAGTLSGFGCQCHSTLKEVPRPLQGAPRSRRIGTFGQTGFTFPSGSTGFSMPAGSTGFTSLPAGTTGITSWDSSIGYGGAGSTYPTSGGSTTPAMQSIGTTAAANAGSTAVSTSIGSTGSTGFWSSFTSDVASVGKAVLPAVGDVASALGSPAGVAAIAGVASAYYANQAAGTEAQTVQTQIARTAAGETPATIAGTTLYSNGSTAPVTSSLLSDLSPSSGSFLIPLLLIGALAFILIDKPTSH
jgi:hypothetical protein